MRHQPNNLDFGIWGISKGTSKYSLSWLLGSISSFLILNSDKDCKGWRSQFRSVAKEGSTKGVGNPEKCEFAMQTRDEKCYAFLAFFAKQKATQRIKI